ncbi:hypothetical protein FRC11_000861 [Ceratobasidium sp. 423]|nr:hypothetical protein FRC11_000861 [Ceratobasidium sp. 423]
MSVSPLPRQHAHTSLGAPNSSLRTRIPKATVPHRAPSRAGSNKQPGAQLIRSRSSSPRPAPLAYNSPPARNRESIVASEDSHGQTIFLNRLPPRVSSLSRPPTRQDIPSSPDDPLFYQPPQPTYPLPHSRSATQQRESMITQSSGQTMSSLYPPSSSSQTGPDSPPSPSTPSAHSSMDPVQTPGFAVDADDVSYRLRLLVRNNYFLPPAHAKPNHSELSLLSPVPPVPVNKTPSPTFRDLFRVGRPRTPSRGAPESPKNIKAPPPIPVVRPMAPVRTVTCPTPMSTAPSLREKERRGRVLVIRERIDDLVTAANSAEIDMRAREEDRRRREPPHASSRPAAVDVIDPTETVDLPAYQFPVQSSSTPFGGLAPDSSIGAAVLADALPPRPEDAEDEAWRKALLHKAVGLSMLSIPEPTPPASQRSGSASPRPTSSARPSPSPGPSGSRSGPNSALPSPAAAPIGRSIVPGSQLSALPPVSPKPSSGIRSPGFATRSPVSKVRELPIGSGPSATTSLPPPPRVRTASKTSLSPASASKPLSPALSAKSLSPASLSPSSPNKSPVKPPGGRPSEGNVGRPSMLPVPKHTVRRALSTPMLAQKVGTAASNANASNAVPPLPSGPSTPSKLKPSTGHLSRSTTPTKVPRAITPIAGSKVPTPSSKGKQRAKTPSISKPRSPPIPRSTTPSIPRATSSMPMDLRAPTPSPALFLETPEGHTMLPTRDTIASFTSGSNYSDDDEIVAVDDDEDEIVAVDDEGDDERDSLRDNEIELPEDDDGDLRAPSRAGVMLRPDSRMTNSTIVRPSFTEGRALSRMSNGMSAFGGGKGKGKDEDQGGPSQRSSIAMPSRTNTLMSEGGDGTVSPPLPKRTSPPLNVRRSQVITPLSLQPLQPPSIASTVASLRSAPPPASTDFFDTVYTQSLEKGGPGFDSDSDETEPPMPIFVQSRSRAVSTTSAVSSRSRSGTMGLGLNLGLGNKSSTSTVMHFSSRSNPYLAMDPNPYQGIDPRKPITNTPPASQTRFKGMGLNLLRPATSMGLRSSGRKSPNMIQHPAIRAGSSMGYAPGTSLQGGGSSSHGHESIRSDAASIRSRAARSEESVTSTVRKNDPSLARLDDLYAMHIEAEKDQMKRIAAASRKPKADSESARKS